MGQGWVFGGQFPRASGSPKSRDGDLRMGGRGVRGTIWWGETAPLKGFVPKEGRTGGFFHLIRTASLSDIS